MTATVAHALRLAEGLEVSTGWNSPYAELLAELRELAAYATEQTAIYERKTEQARTA
ncbi:hypothetical protein [Pseudarthrobacter sp. S6]|uniref:hypothetical protein n=1 Tax=Pseudarthrobacter sp. S6 TaxID=3418420 RepID=UPI003CEE1E6E